jgi:hypothetical protein
MAGEVESICKENDGGPIEMDLLFKRSPLEIAKDQENSHSVWWGFRRRSEKLPLEKKCWLCRFFKLFSIQTKCVTKLNNRKELRTL